MNNAEFSKMFSFNIYHHTKNYVTDNSKNNGSPKYFIGMMFKGTVTLKSRNSVISAKKNDVFFIPKNQLYQSYWFTDENGEIEFLSLGVDNLPLPESVKYSLQKIKCTEEDKNLLREFIKERTTNYKTVSLFYEFLYRVTPVMERKITHNELLIEKALDFMYLNTNYQVRDIASYCNVSEATLYNVFSQNLNKSPNEMKQQIMCEKAIEYLTITNFSVEEISSKLQFSSSSYFRKIFKKHTGKTPLQVRKEAFMQ